MPPTTKPAMGEDQKQKFLEKARELDCDDDEAVFDRRLKALSSAPPKPKSKPKKTKTPAK